MNEQRRTPAMTRHHRVVLGAVLLGLAIGARGELPLAEPPPDAPPAEPPRGIVVPAPEAQQEAGSLDELPAAAVIQPRSKGPYYKHVPPPPPAADALLLDTGDELSGRCLESDGVTVGWTLPLAPDPIHFQCTGLCAVRLAPVANPPAAAQTSWIVRLTNGDLLAGNELTLDAAHLELTSPTAGRLRLARQWVATLWRETSPAAAVRTWQRLAEWDQVKKETSFGQDIALGISRDLRLPDAVELELRTTAPTGLLERTRLQANLFAGPDDVAFALVNLHLSRSMASLATPQGVDWQRQQAELRDAAANDWAVVSVRLNRKAGRLLVLVDGAVKHRFAFVPIADPGARRLHVRERNSTLLADAERLLVTPLPEDVELEVATQPGRVMFTNGDSAPGELAALGAATFVVTTPTGRLELPLERFAGAWLAAVGAGPAARRDAEVSFGLRDGEEFTGTLTGLTADRVTLDSAWGGTLTVARTVVAELRWESPARQRARRQTRTSARSRQPGQPSGQPGKVQLVDGQQLSGTLVGFAADTVSWLLPAATEPATLPRDRVAWATTTVPMLSVTPPPATIRLTTGDRLSGELADADGQAVRLRPRHLPPLAVPRTHVVSLWPGAAPGLALAPGSGITAASNPWTILAPAAGGGGGAATATVNPGGAAAGGGAAAAVTATAGDANDPVVAVNGATWFLNAGNCHYQAALPERLALHLEIAKEDLGGANSLLTVTALNEASKGAGGQCSFLVHSVPQSASSGSLQIPPAKGQAGYGNVALDPHPWNAITAVWLVDRKLSEAFLLVDGRVCGSCRGGAPLADAGLLLFRAQTSAGRLWRLRHVAVSEWRGSVELLGQAAPAGAVSVWRHDLTRVTGNLVRIADGRVLLEGDADGAGVPLAAVARLDFQSPNTPATPASAGEVRVFLPDGDQLTLAAARFDAGGLTGTTAALGNVTVPPAAVVRVDFRPAGDIIKGKKP